MIVTYRPEGSETGTTWEFEPDKVRASRMEMVERRWSGGSDPEAGASSYARWLAAIQQGETRARRVLLWHLLSLEHHALRLEDVDYCLSELEIRYTKSEYDQMMESVRKGRRPEAQRETILATLAAQREEAPDGGKAAAIPPSGSTDGGQP
jgi:hypothetical protein